MRRNLVKFIFRWKGSLIEVVPSSRYAWERVWEFAEANLYPAGMSPAEGKKFVHEYGEVVPTEERP